MEKTETQVSIRVTHALKERLEKRARKERQPVSNLIRRTMEEYLDAKEKEEG